MELNNQVETILFDENMFFLILNYIGKLKDSLSLISICKNTLKFKGTTKWSKHFMRFKYLPAKCTNCKRRCWEGQTTDSKGTFCTSCRYW